MSDEYSGVTVDSAISATESASSSLHVACSIRSDRDRERLVDWLHSREGVTVETVDHETLLSLPFDCCVIDQPTLEAVGDRLLDRVEAERPLSLPCLLVSAAESTDGTPTVPEALGPLVTDVITPPVRMSELERRLDVLFRIRRQSKQLARSNAHHEQLLELLPEAVLVVDGAEIRYANAAADCLFRATRSALVGQSVLDHVAEASRPAAAELLETARRTGSSAFITLELAVDGEPIEIEAAGTATGIGEEVELVCRNLTERNEREAQLELYRRAMDEATIGITITDAQQADNPLVYVNREFEQLTGLDQEWMLGRNPRFAQSPRTDPTTVAEIREAVDAGESISVELINQRADGTEWYNALDISPVHQDGEVTHFLGFQRDVSATRARQNELAVLDRVLRHNLRNRLNVILGHAETLVEGPATEAVPLHASTICRTAEDLLSLSEKTRRFRAALDADTATTARSDLGSIITGCVDDLTAEWAVVVDLDLAAGVEIQSGESVRFALTELLENAVTHSDQEPPHVAVTVDDDGSNATVEIVDDGPGIPESERQAFVDATETQTDHAIGIGLWLVRWAVEAAGGDLDYAEADPHGSIVTLRLPSVS